jgi:hypothetical protein
MYLLKVRLNTRSSLLLICYIMPLPGCLQEQADRRWRQLKREGVAGGQQDCGMLFPVSYPLCLCYPLLYRYCSLAHAFKLCFLKGDRHDCASSIERRDEESRSIGNSNTLNKNPAGTPTLTHLLQHQVRPIVTRQASHTHSSHL